VKTLFLKGVLMLVPFVSLLGLVEFSLRYVPNEYSITKASLDGHVEEVEILITGTSHAQGVAPQFLSRPAFNLAYPSQSLYYDTELVRRYVDSLPKLKLVIFAISNHALEYRLKNNTESWRAGFYRHVYGIPGEDGDPEFKLTNYSYIALLTPKEAVRRATFGFLGAAEMETRRYQTPASNIQDWVSETYGRRRARHHEELMRQADLPFNIAALERGCELLQRKRVSVVFITVPTHHTYYDQINLAGYQRMQESIKQITEKYGVPYFNYLRDDRFTKGDFVDSDHLNSRGAEKFSRILNEDVVKRYVLR
jgi:hypothetical protein